MVKHASWPKYTQKEINNVVKTMRSGKVNYLFGTNGREFEKKFAEFSDVKFSLALANGTLALDIALRALGIKAGDEIIVSPRSYVASASCIALLDAVPVFVDVDLNSQNIDPNLIEQAITRKTKAIICVHLAGMPCDMKNIMKLAKKRSIYVVEDCAQAHGAKINGKSVGSFGHVGTWSFCNDKIMSLGGEGGMITTNLKWIDSFARSFNNHGKNLKKYFEKPKIKNVNNFKYIHDSIGSNYRMTEMQASIGLIQLQYMQKWTAKRTTNAKKIINSVKDLEIIKSQELDKNYKHAWYKCYLILDSDFMSHDWSRDRIIKTINKSGVPCFSGSCPEIYKEVAFKKYNTSTLENAKYLGEYSLMFPVHPTLSKQSINLFSETIRQTLIKASKAV